MIPTQKINKLVIAFASATIVAATVTILLRFFDFKNFGDHKLIFFK